MACDGISLTELCLEDWWWAAAAHGSGGSPATTQPEPTAAQPTATATPAAHAIFTQTESWLAAYFAGERPSIASAPPLNPAGTPFQHEVWDLVAEIPYGDTVSYGDIAAELAERRGGGHMAAQAVGGAVKRNPITIIVPCHRVVGSGRAFGGYGGRLDIKATLLDHEGVELGRFNLPNA